MTRTNNRALANMPNNFVSVLDYGAVGDGVTNDIDAIQAAFNAVKNGETLLFPAGTYLMGVQQNGQGYVKGSNKSFNVIAEGAVFVKPDDSGYAFFQFNHDVTPQNADEWKAGIGLQDNFSWKGGVFDGNQAGQQYPTTDNPSLPWDPAANNTRSGNGAIISIYNFKQISVSSVEIKNNVSNGIVCTGWLSNVSHIHCSGGADVYNKYPQYITAGTAYSPQQLVVDSVQTFGGNIGVAWSNTSTVDENTILRISNVDIYDSIQSGIHSEAVGQLYVSNFNLVNTKLYIGNDTRYFRLNHGYIVGGYIKANNTGGADLSSIDNVTVEDNPSDSNAAFDCTAVKYVSNCTVLNSAQYGFSFGGIGPLVSNCRVDGFVERGISSANSVVNSIVTNGTDANSYGIRNTPTISNTKISNVNVGIGVRSSSINQYNNVSISTTGWSAILQASPDATSSLLISNCHFTNNGTLNVANKDDAVNASCGNIVISNTVFKDQSNGCVLHGGNGGQVKSVTITGCHFVNSPDTGYTDNGTNILLTGNVSI